MRIFLALLIFVALLGHTLCQADADILNQKLDLSYAGAPIITGDYCTYRFHHEFNTLITKCENSEGMLIGN